MNNNIQRTQEEILRSSDLMQLPTYRSRSLTSDANTSFDHSNTVRLNLNNIKNDTDCENLLQNGDDHHVSPLNCNSTASQGVFARKNVIYPLNYLRI